MKSEGDLQQQKHLCRCSLSMIRLDSWCTSCSVLRNHVKHSPLLLCCRNIFPCVYLSFYCFSMLWRQSRRSCFIVTRTCCRAPRCTDSPQRLEQHQNAAWQFPVSVRLQEDGDWLQLHPLHRRSFDSPSTLKVVLPAVKAAVRTVDVHPGKLQRMAVFSDSASTDERAPTAGGEFPPQLRRPRWILSPFSVQAPVQR